ncbi:MAG: peptide chain release factor 1 [Arsenophonus sp.]|nr:MAG: peptide chain release factor 1 [Arsenophonus sp.]
MHDIIINKLNDLEKRYKKIKQDLIKIDTVNNSKLLISLSKEYSSLKNIVHIFKKWKKVQKNIKNTKILLNDKEIYEIAKIELEKLEKYNQELKKKIYLNLLPKKSEDKKNCLLEIRSATGGHESAIFAGNLFRMYYRYAEINNWLLEIINFHPGEHGGYKEIITKISGKNTYYYLQFESGGHRVQRVPNTESQGRIHTSTCTVAVIPFVSKKEINQINLNDLRIDTFRSSGAGGQHVNTTDSAIRITHIPTGIVVECQNERSQHKNKSKAISVLASRLKAIENKKKHEKETLQRKILLGSGERSDRIRTYNFIQGRITDHRINLTIYQLEEVMNGKLEIILKHLIKHNQIEKINNFLEKNNELSRLDTSCNKNFNI